MDNYDIIFAGSIGTYTVVPFNGPVSVEIGGPTLFCAMAASCLGKRIGMITRVSEREEQLLEPLRTAGIDVHIQSLRTPRVRIVFPTANVDERQLFLVEGGEPFAVDEVPPVEPCIIHLAGLGVREFSLEFLKELRARGFRLSIDMMGFMFKIDNSGTLYLEDIPEKEEIVSIADFIKVDMVEASILTGTKVLQEQADILGGWGNAEILITSSEGVLTGSGEEARFERFTNRSSQGRMGRGDTVTGAYLAYRMDHSAGESLRFAAALTSIKLESSGPFHGSLEDVIFRMGEPAF